MISGTIKRTVVRKNKKDIEMKFINIVVAVLLNRNKSYPLVLTKRYVRVSICKIHVAALD